MGLDDWIVRIKRGDSPSTRMLRDTWRALQAFEMPDTPPLRALYAALYRAHDAAQAGSEWAASKLLVEPRMRARFYSVGARVSVARLPYVVGHARITVGDDCRFGKFAVASGRFVDEPELVFGRGCTVGSHVFFSVNK